MTGEPIDEPRDGTDERDEEASDADDADESADAPAWADLGPRDDLPHDEVVRRAAQPSPHPDTTATER